MSETIFESLQAMFPPGTPLEFTMDDMRLEGIRPLCVATYSDGTIIICAFWNADRRRMWAWYDGDKWQVSEQRPSIVDRIKPRQR